MLPASLHPSAQGQDTVDLPRAPLYGRAPGYPPHGFPVSFSGYPACAAYRGQHTEMPVRLPAGYRMQTPLLRQPQADAACHGSLSHMLRAHTGAVPHWQAHVEHYTVRRANAQLRAHSRHMIWKMPLPPDRRLEAYCGALLYHFRLRRHGSDKGFKSLVHGFLPIIEGEKLLLLMVTRRC